MEEKEKVPITIQLFSNSLGEEELNEVRRVFDSKFIGPCGETKLFEKELGEKWGCPYTLATSSCTSALYLSLKVLGIGEGDEVIIPTTHFIGAVNAIIEIGAKPIFADVDLRTSNLLPNEIDRLKTDKTKAVMILHYGGNPCQMDEILEKCNKYELKLIEDNANSPFSSYKGKACGTIGDAGCTSFDAMKILCIGLGGAITLKDEELYKKAMEFRYFGMSNKKQSGIDSLKEGKTERWWELDVTEVARKYVSSDVLSAIGRVQLRKVDGFLQRRKEIWEKYQRELSGLDWLETPPEPLPDAVSSYYMYWVTVKEGQRDALAKHLVDNGIYCSFRYYPLHYVEKYGHTGGNLPNAEYINENVLNIPLHQNLSEEDVDKVINTIKQFGKENFEQKKDEVGGKKLLFDLIRVPDPSSIEDNLDEPLGLLYLGAILRNAGYDVRITNLAGTGEWGWKDKIKGNADIYGVQLFTPTSQHGINIANHIKETIGKPILCGGPHPTAVPNDERLNVFDKIIVGEGEEVILDIAKAYSKGTQDSLPRIIRAKFVEDLDKIPLPAWDLVDMMGFARKVDGKRCFGILGSRGCCYQCTFCDRSLFGSKVRFRSIDNIVKEIRLAMDTYGITHFEFFDDMFTVNKVRLKEFVEKTRGLGLTYRCNGRADILDPEVYQLLQESGCKMICFGIESGSQKILDLMKKGVTVEQNYQAIKMSQEAGVPAMGYFVIGFPGETKETIQESIEFVKKSDIDQAQFYTFIPLPGNEVAADPDKYGITRMSQDWSQYFHVTGSDGHGGKVVDTKWLSADELQEEVKKVRQFLKEHKWRGDMQDYYKEKLKYKTEDPFS